MASDSIFIYIAMINSWHTCQIDFTMVYPQADVEFDLYMEIPQGFDVGGKDSKDFCLTIIKNLYGQKQAGCTWAQYLKKGLIMLGFVQSSADECIYYKGSVIFYGVC
jgi:Reverse transcriptase (RNA-dependent DNA polymerase)